MRLIPATDLNISENRQRREFSEQRLAELAQSILSKGLFHPPVVRELDDGTFELVAGERRLRAIRQLAIQELCFSCNAQDVQPGWLPVTLLGDLDPLALREAELEENTVRADLTWQEKSRAIAELDALRSAQAEASGTPHTLTKMASELLGKPAAGAQITGVAEALLVAKHLENPAIAEAKTQKEALKLIRKQAESDHRLKLAETFDLTSSPHTAVCGSAFVLAQLLEPGIFDCLICDPPYGVGADTFGEQATTTHDYEDTPELALDCCKLIAAEGFRVTKKDAHCYMFLDVRNFTTFSLQFTLAGWKVWDTPLIWAKGGGMLPAPDFGPRRTYEAILYARKGEKRVLKVGPDVLFHSQVTGKEHGAQKPVALYRDLLERSCYPGEKIADFFMGSGTVFPAANQLRLVATGFELVEAHYALAVTRIDQKEKDDSGESPETKEETSVKEAQLSAVLATLRAQI